MGQRGRGHGRYRLAVLVAVAVVAFSGCLRVGEPTELEQTTKLNDVNDAGVAVGSHWRRQPLDLQDRAWRYDTVSGDELDLGTLGGATSTANAINDAGVIVGSSTTTTGATHAFVWDPATATMHDLGTLGGNSSAATDVSAAGIVVGSSTTSTGATHAFVWDPATATMHDLGTLGGTDSAAAAINDANLIVGESDVTGDGASHAFLFDPTTQTMADLGTLQPGARNSGATDLDEDGTVVGWSEVVAPNPCQPLAFTCQPTRAFAYDVASERMTDLGTTGWATHTEATGINDDGIVTGVASAPGEVVCSHCPSVRAPILFELGTSGRYLVSDLGPGGAAAVNDAGLVVGTAVDTSQFVSLPFGFVLPVEQVDG